MPSYKIATALLIGLISSISGLGQTRTAAPAQSKPLPAHPVSGSNARVAGAQTANTTTLRQKVNPAILQAPASATETGPASAQGASASTTLQSVAQTTSGTISVNYHNGLLSVVAERAELGKVLQLVGSKIGTSIEVAPEITTDPVIAHISPATPTQVLAQLLDGPQLEYIVMGSDESGHVLNRVIVRKRSSFARQPLVAIKTPTTAQAPGTAK